MLGYNFTENVRRALALAREQSVRLHHEYIGTEHILLGLIDVGEGVAFDIMNALVASPAEITDSIVSILKPGRAAHVGPDLPYTSRAKKVLELAMAEVRERGDSYVGSEHLLLGLLREEKGIAAQVLIHHGVTLALARAKMLDLLGSPDAPDPLERLPVVLNSQESAPVAARTHDVDPRSPYAALLRYYAAYGERDMELMSELWSRSGRASRVAPDHELVSGWPDVAESYRQLFAKTSRLSIEVKDLSLSALGELAVFVSVEEWTVERINAAGSVPVDVTRVLRQEGGEWRLVHEHVSASFVEALQAYQMLLDAPAP